MFSSNKPNYTKLRTNLRLCINRLKLLEKKKTELALKARREIADFIAAGKEDRARIRVEHIVREDYLVEAMEIIEMLCDLLLARFGLIDRMAQLDPGIEEAVATIIWVTPRLSADVQELQEVSHQLALKYSKEFAEMCRRNEFQKVNEKVIHKMSTAVPPKILIENYMIEIAKSYKVPFEPDPVVMMGEPPAVSNLIDLGMGSNSTAAASAICSAAAMGPGFDTFPTAAATGPAMTTNTSTTDTRSNLYDNNSAADQKRQEAMGGMNNKRPPSPPGGGGGTACMTPGGAMGNSYPTAGAAQMNQYSPPPNMGLPPAAEGYTPVGPPPLPSKPPNSNQGSPESLNQGAYGGAGGKQPYNPDMWLNDDQLPSLPAYDTVVNSPKQYPSTGTSADHTSPPLFPQDPQEPPIPQPRHSPVPAPRGQPGHLPDPPPNGADFPGLPSVPTNSVGVNSAAGDDINFDDLTRRFEELKRKK